MVTHAPEYIWSSDHIWSGTCSAIALTHHRPASLRSWILEVEFKTIHSWSRGLESLIRDQSKSLLLWNKSNMLQVLQLIKGIKLHNFNIFNVNLIQIMNILNAARSIRILITIIVIPLLRIK
jgi:hypothetical protein